MVDNSDTKYIALIGETGAGKSTLVSILTGRNAVAGNNPDGVTKDITFFDSVSKSPPLKVADVPGFGDMDVNMKQLVQKWNSAMYGKQLHLILICSNATKRRLTSFEKDAVKIIQLGLRPQDFSKCVVLVATNCDRLRADEQSEFQEYLINFRNSFNRNLQSNIEKVITSRKDNPWAIQSEINRILQNQSGVTAQSIPMSAVEASVEQIQQNHGKRCFSLDSKILIDQFGTTKLLGELKKGDKLVTFNVKKNELVSDEVLAQIHYQEKESAQFKRIHFSDKTFITLTPNHMISSGKKRDYVMAYELTVGDTIQRFDIQKRQCYDDQITQISQVTGSGFMSILTKSGTIIVDGCIASCYANTSQQIAEIVAWPAKHIDQVKNLGLNENGVHKYFSLLMKTSKFVPFIETMKD